MSFEDAASTADVLAAARAFHVPSSFYWYAGSADAAVSGELAAYHP